MADTTRRISSRMGLVLFEYRTYANLGIYLTSPMLEDTWYPIATELYVTTSSL